MLQRKRVNFSDPPVSCRKYIERQTSKCKQHRLKPKVLDISDGETSVKTSELDIIHIIDEEEDTKQNANKIQETVISEAIIDENNEKEIVFDINSISEQNFGSICDLYKKNKVTKLVQSTNEEIEIITNSSALSNEVFIEEITTPSESVINIVSPTSESTEFLSELPNINDKTIVDTSFVIEIESSPETNVSKNDQNKTILENLKNISNISECITPVLSNNNDDNTSPIIVSNTENSCLNSKAQNEYSEKEYDFWDATQYDNTIYKKLFNCNDSLYKNVQKLPMSNKAENISFLLELNAIKTIGDLAKLKQDDINRLPIEIDVIKMILENHKCEEHLYKRIKPVHIGPSTSKQRTNKVSVIASSENFTPINVFKEEHNDEFQHLINLSPISSTDINLQGPLSPPSSLSSSSSDSPPLPLTPVQNESLFRYTTPVIASPREIGNVKISGGYLQDVLAEIKSIFLDKVSIFKIFLGF